MDYPKEFKRIRKQMKWSKAQLADLLAISSEEDISNIENSIKTISSRDEKSFKYIVKLIEQGCEFNIRINSNDR
tara:strand:- start:3246 stop:3467 length:222 start_codon:yes stop_codon:yes gene_type:complete